jgi:outer membrane protein insertion porin family
MGAAVLSPVDSGRGAALLLIVVALAVPAALTGLAGAARAQIPTGVEGPLSAPVPPPPRSPAAAIEAAAAEAGREKPAAPAQEPPEEIPGPLVKAIEIRSEAPLGPQVDLDSLLEVEVGEPVTDGALRRTVRNLVATGRAPDVEVYTLPQDGGVAVVLVLRPVVMVREVRITGQLGLDESVLAARLPQKAAQPLAEESVVGGVFNLQDLYRDEGYFKATVHVHVVIDERERQASVVYDVASGARAAIAAVHFEGPIAPFTPEALAAQLKAGAGKPYRHRVGEDDAEQLQLWLIEKEYNAAHVERPREAYDAAANAVDLTFPIDVGPHLIVRVLGADLKKLKKSGLLPFLGEQGFDEALVQQALTRIKAWYQQQGHYHVSAEASEQRRPGELEITLTIVPGPVYALAAVELRGNERVSSAKLAQLMATGPRSLLRPGSGRLVQDVLDADLENIRSYYALQGYAQAEVGPVEVREQGKELRLTVPIKEGPQLRVVRLDLHGVERLDTSQLAKALPLQAGGPFHPVLLEQTLDTLRNAYAERGFVHAQVSARSDWDRTHTLVDLDFDVLEGPQRVVDRVIVRGNRRTHFDVIRRAAGLRRGQPIGLTTLYEVESRLYRLGIFSMVDAQLAGSAFDSPQRDVVIRLEEGKSNGLVYGVGYDTYYGLRGLLGFSSNNVGGRAWSLRTDLRLSQRDTHFRVVFDQPYLASLPLPLTSTLFYFDTVEPSYRVKRRGARAETSKVVSRTRYSLALDYRTVQLRVDPGISLNFTERRDLPYQLASAIPAVLVDHRDDPLVPTRGWSSLAQVQYSFPAFNSQADFVKLFLQHTQYVNLGRPGVLAGSLRVGGIEAFRDLPGPSDVPQVLASRNVFINERFFAGGSSTHRAYGLDLLGLRGQTLFQPAGKHDFEPVGGNGLLLANLDYRFPIVSSLGGTLFFDAGNVWADWRDIRLSQLRSGVGFGLRYLSAIGPLRLEMGWKLHRDRHPDEPPYVVSFGFGNPF